MKTRWLFLIVILLSCRGFEKDSITEFVLYSYDGYRFVDSVKHKIDTTQLEIRRYIEFDSLNDIKILRNKRLTYYLWQRNYYKISRLSHPGLLDTLNRYLLNHKYRVDYLPKTDDWYDGLFFSIFYKTKNKEEVLINYVPDAIPDSLRQLHDYINKIIISANQKSGTFEVNDITIKDAIRLLRKLPPPVPAVEDTFKFKKT